MLHAGRVSGRMAGTEFDDFELRHNDPPQLRSSHRNAANVDATTKEMSQSSHAAPDASPLHTVLDVREATHQPREDPEEDSGPRGPSTEAGHERRSLASLAQQVEDDGEDESESDGHAEDLPDEESFLAQLQRLDHEGKLKNLSSAHVPCEPPFASLLKSCLSKSLQPAPFS